MCKRFVRIREFYLDLILMNKHNKVIKYALILVLFLLLLIEAKMCFASDFSFGITAGPAIGFNSDFNNKNTKTALHFALGADVFYRVPCRNSFCNNLFINASFTWITPTTYNFGSTQVSHTGRTGNFSEKQFAYGASLGIRKYFLQDAKFNFFAGFGLGFEYYQISASRYLDQFGKPLGINTSSSSINMSIVPQVGISYKISHKLMLDFSVKAHTTLPAFYKNSYLEFPVSIKFSF